jgi:hypothetical protein
MELLALNGTDATPHVVSAWNSGCYTPLSKTLSVYNAQRSRQVNETAYGATGEQHRQGESDALGEKPLPTARCPSRLPCPMAWDRTGPPPSADVTSNDTAT